MMTTASPAAYRPTEQQRAIIDYTGDLSVDACAGSEKTETLAGYAHARPTRRILYLAFNRTVRVEAQVRFAKRGIRHVEIHAAHSLAYGRVTKGSGYSPRKSGEWSVVDLLGVPPLKALHGALKGAKLAAHVRKLLAWYAMLTCATWMTYTTWIRLIGRTDDSADSSKNT